MESAMDASATSAAGGVAGATASRLTRVGPRSR